MNNYIAPHEFAGLVFFEEEHPLMERENENGQRHVIVYHTAGENIEPISHSV